MVYVNNNVIRISSISRDYQFQEKIHENFVHVKNFFVIIFFAKYCGDYFVLWKGKQKLPLAMLDNPKR